MVSRIACVMVVIMTSFSISETVVGESSPFHFPGGIGIIQRNLSLESFVHLKSILMNNGCILFTWSMKSETKSGKITIYSLSGRTITSINILSANGSVKWNARKSGIANGIYFATLEAGTIKQKIRFTVL